MNKLPLTNTETRKIPIGSRIKGAIKKKPQSELAASGDISCNLDVPKLHSTNLILKNIRRLEAADPDLTRMVEEKLGSPNTAKYIRRKKASKVNIKQTKLIFQDLVSADVSQQTLIRGLEDDLRQKAAIVQPTFRAPDPEPTLSDYLFHDELVNVRVVGPSNIFPIKRQSNSYLFRSNHKNITDYNDRILDQVDF